MVSYVHRIALSACSVIAGMTFTLSASAGDVDSVNTTRSSDIRAEIPIVAYAYSANGVSAGTMGAALYGQGLMSSSSKIGGGGATVWGSPIDRLTLVADAQRDIFGNFAPSAAAMFRLYGTPGHGLSLAALGKFKVDGFGVGPNHEMESEVEGGLLLSYAQRGFHLDLNAITGVGTGDDGEVDSEGRLRIGQDLGRAVRLGVDGQARYRLNGATPLPGNRTWDFAAGPQLLVGSHAFFGAITAGPTTMNVYDRALGWTGVISIGGATL
jgi:hypothetical protein